MRTTERICAHDVEFNLFSRSKIAVIDDTDIEHVQDCIIENYVQGELCTLRTVNGRTHEFRGWWKIKDN